MLKRADVRRVKIGMVFIFGLGRRPSRVEKDAQQGEASAFTCTLAMRVLAGSA